MMVDFKILSKYTIITNSSFSWWASWLSNDKEIVILLIIGSIIIDHNLDSVLLILKQKNLSIYDLENITLP
jgi:hypothetical protein